MTGEWFGKLLLFVAAFVALALVSSIIECFVAYPLWSSVVLVAGLRIGFVPIPKACQPQLATGPVAGIDRLASLRVLYARDEIAMLDHEGRAEVVRAR
jgi:hypothetical protein